MMRSTGTLVRDRNGAIVVVAVFMSAFLVGCLWYLIGIGDAVVYRERMQDGADAAAYVSAVYHARGMNVIVVLNLVMAAIMAVIIGLKVLQIVTGIVALIAGIICAIPLFGTWACPIAATATSLFSVLSRVVPRVQQVADRMLTTLSSAQRGVARITPWVGSFQGFRHAQRYSPHVERGVALSVSMIPGDERLGLPIQEQPLPDLCGKAGRMIVSIIPLPGGFKKIVGGAFAGLVTTFSGFFCGVDDSGFAGGGGGLSNVDPDNACDESQKQADEAVRDWERQKALAEAKGQQPPPKPEEFKRKDCVKNIKKAQKKGGGGADTTPLSNARAKTAKEIYLPAMNGDDYFSVFGLVEGDTSVLKRDHEKGVGIAAWQAAPPADNQSAAAAAGEKLGFARADFYYDQTADDGSTDWFSYSSDALWHLRWRARLRRFRLPTPDIAGALIGGVTSALPGIPAKYNVGALASFDDGLNRVLSGDYVAELIGSRIDSAVDQTVGEANRNILH